MSRRISNKEANPETNHRLTEGVCLRIVGSPRLGRQFAEELAMERAAPGDTPLCVLRVQGGPSRRRRPFLSSHESCNDKGPGPHAVKIDFGALQPGCTFTCSPDAPPGDVLPWLNVLLPDVGVAPLHASAFVWRGQGVVLTGSAGSGKTGALLAAVNEGAEVIGDECIWLTRDARLRGLPRDMEIRPAYLREFPAFRAGIPATAAWRARLYEGLAAATHSILPGVSRKLAGRARVHVRSDRLLGRHIKQARMDRLFILETRAHPDIVIYPLDAEQAASRVLHIQMAEYGPQRAGYARYRERFPERKNASMEQLEGRLSDLLVKALRGTRAFVVEHPSPVSAREMFKTLATTWP